MTDYKLPIFDYNYHLPKPSIGKVDLQKVANKVHLDEAIAQEFDLTGHNWERLIADAALNTERKCAHGANLMILDQKFIKNDACVSFLGENGYFKANNFTVLLDFRDGSAETYVKNWARAGGLGIKFHPYLQKIRSEDFNCIVDLCRLASRLGLVINVDCSYGTLELYSNSGPELLAEILKAVSDTPVVCLHFGGAKILDIHALGHAASNLFIDLSLSLSYWKGSSVENDLAYSVNSLGSHRFMFGSDHPFILQDTAYKDFMDFSKTYGLDEGQVADISNRTAYRLLLNDSIE